MDKLFKEELKDCSNCEHMIKKSKIISVDGVIKPHFIIECDKKTFPTTYTKERKFCERYVKSDPNRLEQLLKTANLEALDDELT